MVLGVGVRMYFWAFGIIAKNMKQFDMIANEVKTNFQGIIKDVDTMLIIEEYKYDYLVDLIKWFLASMNFFEETSSLM